MNMQTERKFKETIDKYNLLNEGDRVIAAVSGGADSVCLLTLLNYIKDNLNLYIHVVTFNHLIREDAHKDVEFVKRLAAKLNLPMTIGEADVPKYAKSKKLSLEEAARILRFAFLKETALENKADKIALGHNLDDQVETFLMRLIRGAGLTGLCGISPKRKEDDFYFIRPLIEISRREIEAFLERKKIKYRTDKTNKSTVYFRNKIRLKLLPLLAKEYNPNIKEIIPRTIHNLREVNEFLEKEVELKAKKNIHKEDGHLFLELKNLEKLPWIIKTGILRKAVLEFKGDLKQLSYENWAALEKLAFERQSGRRLSLPAGITVRKTYDTLVFEKEADKNFSGGVKKKKLNCPGNTLVQDLGIEISAEILPRTTESHPALKHWLRDKGVVRGKNKSKWIEFFDADKIEWPVFARVKEEKDIFRPLGMRGTKTLKEFFIDEKIPVFQRDKIPIFEAARRIIWVGGARISDDVKITEKTNRVLKLEVVHNVGDGLASRRSRGHARPVTNH